jgi:hypothetical protein
MEGSDYRMRSMRSFLVRRSRSGGGSPAAFVSLLLLSCLIDLEAQQPVAQQPGVQQFDQPQAGARSPRNANYEIDVALDHAARRLTGRETIRWRNISVNATSELQFHLYWNAWRDLESTWLRERRLAGTFRLPRADAWGSMDVTRVRVRDADLTAQKRFIAPDDGNAADETVMSVPLPFVVPPNETIDIEVEWTAKVPRPFARTGYVGNYYFIAHWFPKLGVLEDAGWNTHQFHSATGEDIHDFAWTTSPDFVEARQTFTHATLPKVEMRLLLQPEHAGQEQRHFSAAGAALRYGGEWFGAYPYEHLTVIDPAFQSGSGGMEYPTLITAGTRWIAPALVSQPDRVTIHEAIHQFWYGIVGSNEFEHAWLDEGFTTFTEARVMETARVPNHPAARSFAGFIPWPIRDTQLARATDGNRLPGYRVNAEADVPSTPTFRYWPATAASISYDKTALWLHTLERYLGWPVLQRAMSTYFDRWKFRHPRPADFFASVNEASGQDLRWFFDETYRTSNVFDYGIQSFSSTRVRLPPSRAQRASASLAEASGGGGKPDSASDDGYRTIVVAQRLGEAVFPVEVVTSFRDGQQVSERWDGRDRRVIYAYERPSEALTAHVDPGRVLLLDVNYTNNSATLMPRAREAGLKWGLKWLVWLQELLLTYAFFV